MSNGKHGAPAGKRHLSRATVAWIRAVDAVVETASIVSGAFMPTFYLAILFDWVLAKDVFSCVDGISVTIAAGEKRRKTIILAFPF